MHALYQRWRRTTFGVTWLIYAAFYFTRQAFSVAKVALDDDPRVRLTRADIGLVDSAYLGAYMLGQFLFGPLGDRYGPRRILLWGMTGSVLAAVASGYASGLAGFATLAAVQGLAQSTGWSGVTKTMSSWFSVKERGRVIGWWCTHYTAGSAAALPFAGLMMDLYGRVETTGQGAAIVPYWAAAFWGTAAVLGAVTLISFVLLRDRPEDVGLPPIEDHHREPDAVVPPAAASQPPLPAEDRQPPPEGSWAVVGAVLSSPSIWLLATAYFSIKLTRYAFLLWGPKYIYESLGNDAYSSAMTAAAMPIGGLVGVIGIGYVSDKGFQARRAPAAVLSLLAAAAVMLAGLARIDDVWTMAGFFFLVGVFLFGPDSVISATASIDFGTKRGAGTATGFVNGIGSVGGILGGYLPGKITTGDDWTTLFVVLVAGLLASAVLLTPLWNVTPPTD